MRELEFVEAPVSRAGGAVSDDAAADSPSGLAKPAPARFPVTGDDQPIVEYWSANARTIRQWVIELLGAERPAIEDAYHMAEWHATREAMRPLRWYERSLMNGAIRDVLTIREAVLRRAP